MYHRIKLFDFINGVFMWFSNDFFTVLNNAGRTQNDTDLLNQTLDSIKDKINSCENVQKLPEIRRNYVKGGSRKAFASWKFDGNSHYYIHTVGTRSELQPNIGVWADNRIRVGYGFELTGAGYGEPKKCRKFIQSTIKLLKSQQVSVTQYWEDCVNIYVESHSKQDGFSAKCIKPSELVDFLSMENQDWLFFGHIIDMKDDDSNPSTLSQTTSLEFINKLFGNTLGFYDAVWQIYKSIP
jgi:hypothetical protein